MACTVKDIVEMMQRWAPEDTAEPWDAVGLQIGSLSQTVHRVLVALDATPAVAKEAQRIGAQMVICHHPRIFSPLKNLCDEDTSARAALSFVRAGIAVYAAHTNLDRAPGGVNDVLAQKLGIVDSVPFYNGFARIGMLEAPMTLEEWALDARVRLQAGTAWIAGKADGQITRVAAAAGSCGDALIEAAAMGAQALLTGEAKHHEALMACELGMGLVMVGHGATEAPIVQQIVHHLQTELVTLQLLYNIDVLPSQEDALIWRSVVDTGAANSLCRLE